VVDIIRLLLYQSLFEENKKSAKSTLQYIRTTSMSEAPVGCCSLYFIRKKFSSLKRNR